MVWFEREFTIWGGVHSVFCGILIFLYRKFHGWKDISLPYVEYMHWSVREQNV